MIWSMISSISNAGSHPGLQVFLAIQASPQCPHWTPPWREVRKPMFQQGSRGWFGSLDTSSNRNLCYLLDWTAGKLQYISMDWQLFDCLWPFSGPFWVLEFASDLAMSTRSPQSLVSFHKRSTETVPEKVHTFNSLEQCCIFCISAGSCMCLLGQFSEFFSLVSTIYNSWSGILPCIFPTA